jgi:hypothetical protein
MSFCKGCDVDEVLSSTLFHNTVFPTLFWSWKFSIHKNTYGTPNQNCGKKRHRKVKLHTWDHSEYRMLFVICLNATAVFCHCMMTAMTIFSSV